MLDGEIVALDDRGRPAGFQRLQGRIHLTGAARSRARRQGAANGVHRVRPPARRQRRSVPSAADRERRAAAGGALRSDVSRQGEAGHDSASASRSPSDGRALHARALKEHWEGLIAKDAASVYQVGTALAGVAQDQGRPRAGIRRRRLDGAAPDAAVFRRAAPRRLRGRPARSTSATRAPGSIRKSWRASGRC